MTDSAVIERLLARADLRRLHRLNPDRYPFLLQSTATVNSLGRYDILFLCPGERIVAGHGPFLNALDRAFMAERGAVPETELPFTGGWFLYLGYELAAEIENGLDLRADTLLPAAFAVRCKAAIVHDLETDVQHLVVEPSADFTRQQLDNDIAASSTLEDTTRAACHPVVTEAPSDEFTDAVIRAKEYIAAGDIYQANLSRGWHVAINDCLTSDDLYAALCSANPAPFAGIASWNGASIMSSSPERLLHLKDGDASTRPIAGTRPRSRDEAIDADLSSELFAHPKERAEHVMLIDLERNDLGRICEPGTVTVDEMMVLESYAHVHHIVSNVRGTLRGDVTPGQAIAAVFPGGTITGCPKVRCMEIIDELEHEPRGAYTGSFGYLNLDGSMDLNILIRTMVMRDNVVNLRAGSGIVADSEPDAELAETRAKAKGMIKALPQ